MLLVTYTENKKLPIRALPTSSVIIIGFPVDTGRKLNVVLDVFWRSYVRSIYVLCLRGCKSDVEVNRNTKLVSTLNRGRSRIIKKIVEKIFVVAEAHFHVNSQKSGFARDFLTILNILLKYQCQVKFWMLQYTTYSQGAILYLC